VEIMLDGDLLEEELKVMSEDAAIKRRRPPRRRPRLSERRKPSSTFRLPGLRLG
jgi:hypothetical protein